MYQALYRKWRPRTFDEVVGQEHITETLKRQVAAGRLSHAYLFTGTRGTGKTTCAKLLARAVNCLDPQDGNPCGKCEACVGIENGSVLDVLELDAASNNRVDDIRAILDEAVYTPATVKKRVYIIDEVHMLSAQAFNALLQILEEPPAHLMFILATTEIHKVPATIKSRCQQFSFKRIRAEEIENRLLYVAGQEGIDLTSGGAALIARLADGGMRDALSLLDQCVGAGGTVEENRVFSTLGLAGNLETAALMGDIADGNGAAALVRLDQLYAGGKEMAALVSELAALTRDLLVRRTAPRAGSALMTGGFDETTLKNLSGRFDVPRLVQMLNLLQKTAADVVRSSNRRTDVELLLVTLCDPTLDQSPAGLNARVSRLEQGGIVASAPVQAAPTARPQSAPQPKPRSKAEASAASEPDLPPWEVPQGEPEPAKKTKFTPAQPIPTKGSEPDRKPAPAAEPAASPAPAAWPGWPVLRDALQPDIGMGDYVFLSNPDMVDGCLTDSKLTLWACNEFIKGMIDKQAILEKVARKAAQLAGRPIRVEVKVGQAPAENLQPAPAADDGEFDALEAFLAEGHDNLIVE
jgi:DNA polymerase III subunit gamma/tau